MKNILHPLRKRARGFTVIEIMIASGIFTVLIGATTMAMQQSMLGVACASLEGGMDAKGSDILELMAKELKDSGSKYANFAIDANGQSITFARSTGYTAGNTVFGNQIRYYTSTDANGNRYLARDEIVGGTAQTTILSNQLSSTATSVTAVKGINGPGYNVSVTGVNFTRTAAHVVTITLILQQRNDLLIANSATGDNTMTIISQGSVQLLNEL
ncbi:MAG: prepilin-type N-terminal cleavage/methylation domain-containing protein [Planctomycetota bacterium]